MNMVKAFLCTYQSFTTPKTLLKKLVDRFHVPQSIPQTDKVVIQMRICTLIKHWVEMYFGDLGDILDSIIEFIDNELSHESGLAGLVDRLKKTISSRV